ncbi:MAG TPA: hypothetical protein VGJ55_02725 [Pyrinomonadaceae bacterium]
MPVIAFKEAASDYNNRSRVPATIVDFGVRRQSEAATALWLRLT